MFTSSPCGGVAGIEKLALSACGGLTLFTRRQSGRHYCIPTVEVSLAVRGKVHSFGGAGAAGVFSLVHGRNVFAARPVVYHHNRSFCYDHAA